MADDIGIVKNGELSGSSEIAKKVVEQNGGNSILDKALSASKNPFIKAGLKSVGIDTNIIESAANEIKGAVGHGANAPGTNAPGTNAPGINQNTTKTSSLLDRLNQLK